MKIAVFGDIILDKYVFGDVDRISPEGPVPILKINKILHKLGGAANVASNLRKLTPKVSLFGMIGKDILGIKIKKLISQNKIKSRIIFSKHPTIVKTRFIARSQQLLRADEEIYFSRKYFEILSKKYLSEKFPITVLSDYNKGTLHDVQYLIKKSSSRFLIDPKGDFEKYKNAYLLTPNFREISNIIGKNLTNQQFKKECCNLRRFLNLKYLIVKKGPEGAFLFSENNKCNKFNTKIVEVMDITGAGDTLIATLAYLISQNKNVNYALQKAVNAATMSVTKLGTFAISKRDIKK